MGGPPAGSLHLQRCLEPPGTEQEQALGPPLVRAGRLPARATVTNICYASTRGSPSEASLLSLGKGCLAFHLANAGPGAINVACKPFA